eukprot:6030148-Amphidinium_carterae.1
MGTSMVGKRGDAAEAAGRAGGSYALFRTTKMLRARRDRADQRKLQQRIWQGRGRRGEHTFKM